MNTPTNFTDTFPDLLLSRVVLFSADQDSQRKRASLFRYCETAYMSTEHFDDVEKDLDVVHVETSRDVLPQGDDFDFVYTSDQVDAYVVDPAISRQVVRAYDLRILPLSFFMYLFSALDRGNISASRVVVMHDADLRKANAKTDGFNADLHLVGKEYHKRVAIQAPS